MAAVAFPVAAAAFPVAAAAFPVAAAAFPVAAAALRATIAALRAAIAMVDQVDWVEAYLPFFRDIEGIFWKFLQHFFVTLV